MKFFYNRTDSDSAQLDPELSLGHHSWRLIDSALSLTKFIFDLTLSCTASAQSDFLVLVLVFKKSSNNVFFKQCFQIVVSLPD